MALPAGTDYDLATVTNPGSALTDFTLIVDLSNCTSDFKSGWNTDSNGYGRAAIHASGTELPCDWIDLDYSAGTGLVRVKWSGTLAASGTQQLRLYPPNTSNSQYSARDTYGSDNAYDSSTWGYWPMHDANDRTSNGYDLTGSGGISFGGVSGLIGDCTNFDDGSSQYVESQTNFDFSSDWSYSCLVNFDTGSGDQALLANPDENDPLFWRDEYASGDRLGLYIVGGTTGYDSTALGTGTWYHAGVGAGSTSPIYSDGSSGGSGDDIVDLTTASYPRIGAWSGGSPGRLLDGKLQHIMLSTTQRSADWFAEESSQLKDNSTFWGSWAWQGGAGGNQDVTASDGFEISEINTVIAGLLSTIADGITLSETISVVSGLLALSTDGIELSDITNYISTIQAAIADGITLSDSGLSTLNITSLVLDGITLSDSNTIIAGFRASVLDGFDISEVTSALQNIILEISDGVTISDVAYYIDEDIGRILIVIESLKPVINITSSKPIISIAGSKPTIDISVQGG